MSEQADWQTTAEFFRARSLALEAIVDVALPKMEELTAALKRARAEVQAVDRRNNVNVGDPIDMLCGRMRDQFPELADMTNQQVLQYMSKNPERFKPS